MYTSTQKIRAFAFASALVFVVAGMLAGAVQAGTNAGGYLQHGGRAIMSSRCPCNSGLPGALESGALVEASVQKAPSSQCPCNVGLPGMPSQLSRAAQKPAAAPVSENSPIENRLTPASPVVVPTTRSGFDWGDALIGAAVTAGVFLLGAAGALVLHRRRGLAHL
jgi:hypothetical protein